MYVYTFVCMYVCTYVCIGIDKENHKLTKNSLVIIVTFKSSHGFMGIRTTLEMSKMYSNIKKFVYKSSYTILFVNTLTRFSSASLPDHGNNLPPKLLDV